MADNFLSMTMHHTLHHQYMPLMREARLLHMGFTQQSSNEADPSSSLDSGLQYRSLPETAGNLDEIRSTVGRQMNQDYRNALHEAHAFQGKQLQYLGDRTDFFQHGWDQNAGVALGQKITLNGWSMGTNSLGYMQSRLNRHEREQRKGRRGLPDWQVQQYRQMIPMVAAQQQQTMMNHMRGSMELFDSKKAEQLNLPQNPDVDRGIQQTVEQRQQFEGFLKGVAECITQIIAAFQKLGGSLNGPVAPAEVLTGEQVQKWMNEHGPQLQEVSRKWNIPMDDLQRMIREEDEWSLGKLDTFLKDGEEIGKSLSKLKKELEKREKILGAYEITFGGIRLKHPVGELHRALGVEKEHMPVVVSFERARDAIKIFAEGYATA